MLGSGRGSYTARLLGLKQEVSAWGLRVWLRDPATEVLASILGWLYVRACLSASVSFGGTRDV